MESDVRGRTSNGYANPAPGYSPTDPSTWDRWGATAFILGVDVGMHSDHSTFVLGGVWPMAGHAIGVIDVKQFPLGTPLEMVADDCVKVARENQAKIVVDASNNSAFFGVLAARLPQPAVNHLVAATIVSMAAHASQPTPMAIAIGGLASAVTRWTLSKSELIETLGAELGAKLIRVARVGDWELLQDELATMERTVRASGSASYSAPSGKHDDLVMALSLAVFGCRRFGQPAHRRHFVQARVGAAGWT
jgi:hypothetical protein